MDLVKNKRRKRKMSTRNSNTKSTSTKSNTNPKATGNATPQQSTPSRNQTMSQPTTQVSTTAQASATTRRARKPVTIRVRATGEEIRRVPVERSGYRVVRYEGRYHTVRGGGRTAPYIVGSEDSEDVLGRA